MKRLLLMCACILLSAGLSGCGKQQSVDISQKYKMDKVNILKVDNSTWELKIKESGDSEIHVNATGKVGNDAALPRVELQENGTLLVMQSDSRDSFTEQFAMGKKGEIAIFYRF